ncbi:MAG: VOC family protein [Proteobacteria bacterium]|nr:VOC family protein [Pseudomonadota bacterium]
MANNIHITGVAHLGIRVHDLDRSRKFYQQLGFELIAGPVGPEPVAILKHPGGVEINLILNAAKAAAENILMDVAEKYPGYTHAALAVRDLDAAKARLDELDIEITGGPVDYPGGARGLFIRDPDRNVVELYQPA